MPKRGCAYCGKGLGGDTGYLIGFGRIHEKCAAEKRANEDNVAVREMTKAAKAKLPPPMKETAKPLTPLQAESLLSFTEMRG